MFFSKKTDAIVGLCVIFVLATASKESSLEQQRALHAKLLKDQTEATAEFCILIAETRLF